MLDLRFNYHSIHFNSMKNKNLVSLTMAGVILVLSFTGLWLFAISHNHVTSGIHLTFGVAFVFVAMYHIKNNWGSLKKYSANTAVEPNSTKKKVPRELFWASGIVLAFLVSAYYEIPPLGSLDKASDGLRGLWQKPPVGKRKNFTEIETQKATEGKSITLQFEKSKSAQLPLVTVSLIDSSKQLIEAPFVPSKIITVKEGTKDIEEAIREHEVVYIANPTTMQKNFPEATPTDDFILHSKISRIENTHLLIEVKDGGKTFSYDVPLLKNSNAYKVDIEKGSPHKKIIVTLD